MKTIINSKLGVKIIRDENGVEIEGLSDGSLVFGNKWDDLYAVIEEGKAVAELISEDYRDTGFRMKFFTSNQDKSIYMTYQMPHGWDYTTSVRPHMHYIPMANVTGDVLFTYEYAYVNVNQQLPAIADWTQGTSLVTIPGTDTFKHKVVSFGTITLPNAGPSTILVFKVSRLGTDPSDTYNGAKQGGGTNQANLGILFFDLHYQKKSAGTDEEFPSH